MPPRPRRPQQSPGLQSPQRPHKISPHKTGGRPKGPPSTILNLRLPLELLARLDRYLDHLESRTGLKANRGMIARRALALFLEAHLPDDTTPARESGPRAPST